SWARQVLRSSRGWTVWLPPPARPVIPARSSSPRCWKPWASRPKWAWGPSVSAWGGIPLWRRLQRSSLVCEGCGPPDLFDLFQRAYPAPAAHLAAVERGGGRREAGRLPDVPLL